MPNHFHILIAEIQEDGIVRFMQKLLTGYSMYFNEKNARVGNLMVKPFRSKHIHNDVYLRKVAQYIHLNPAEVFEPGWKEGRVRNIKMLEEELRKYEYSSLIDHLGTKRLETAILETTSMNMLSDGRASLSELLVDAQQYYTEAEKEFGLRKSQR